jgi:carbon-monoxide dehydrogenase large subunit
MSVEQTLWMGAPLPLQQGTRLVRGKGKFINDVTVVGHLHVAFVRSDVAHARLAGVHVAAAREHPDAVAVLTAEDLVGQVKPYWGGMRVSKLKRSDSFPMARDRVRYVGEPIAAVVARDRYVAEDIAELVQVEYDELPPVIDPVAAMAHGGARLYDEWPDNVLYTDHFDEGGTQAAFESAHLVVKRRFKTNRHTGAPLETRGAIAEWDDGNGTLTLTANLQDVHLARTVLADLLDLPPSHVRVMAPDSGGGFGVKLPIYPCEITLCVLARLLRQPVKWIQDRREDLLTTTQSRDAIVEAALAFDKNGKVLGLKADILSDAGAYAILARGNTVEGMMTAQDMCGPYKIPAYSYDLNIVMTNKPPLCVYRGVGIPICILVMERLMDIASAQLGIDRVDLRKRNLIQPQDFPYVNIVGYDIEPGSYVEALETAAREIGYENFRDLQAEMRKKGRLVGLGISTGNEATARGAAWYGKRGVPISGQEGCTIKIDPVGRVYAQMGTTSQGQGLEQSCAQLIADRLGVRPTDVRIVMGDTEITPYGGGTWASRCAVTGGSAAMLAANELREKLMKIASHVLEAAPADLIIKDGAIHVAGSPKSRVTISELAKIAYFVASDMPPNMRPGLEATAHYEPPTATFSNSTHAAIVEVDVHTGAVTFLRYVVVEDCGRILNHAIVRGQVMGGLAQGLGGALLEHSVFDPNGQPRSTTLMDYLIPTVDDLPERVEINHIETPSPRTEGGMKGVGESGVCYAPAAVANAVNDALKHLGVEINDLPLSPAAIRSCVAGY